MKGYMKVNNGLLEVDKSIVHGDKIVFKYKNTYMKTNDKISVINDLLQSKNKWFLIHEMYDISNDDNLNKILSSVRSSFKYVVETHFVNYKHKLTIKTKLNEVERKILVYGIYK